MKIEKIRIIVAYWPMITNKEMFYKNHRYALKKKTSDKQLDTYIYIEKDMKLIQKM